MKPKTMTPTPPDKGATPHCPRCGRSVPLYGQWCGDCPPDKDELDEIFQKLVYEQLPIKATEIGWEAVGEQVEEAKQAINRLITQANKDLLERVRSEVIGKDKVNHNHVWHTTAGCGCTYFTEGDKANNELKAEQRSALQKIEESL